MSDLPPCGLYVTRAPVSGVPAGRLVYFHNHGEPGPGVYLPTRWSANRAVFEERGYTLASPDEARSLQRLPAEGLYRVAEPFHCCAQKCRLFERDLLVQLGYDAGGVAILFIPEMSDDGLGLPVSGTRIERENFASLAPLRVVRARPIVDRTMH